MQSLFGWIGASKIYGALQQILTELASLEKDVNKLATGQQALTSAIADLGTKTAAVLKGEQDILQAISNKLNTPGGVSEAEAQNMAAQIANSVKVLDQSATALENEVAVLNAPPATPPPAEPPPAS